MNTIKDDILCSVLIPTRKRVKSLEFTLNSFILNTPALHRYRVELVVGIDEDDLETLTAIPQLKGWVEASGLHCNVFVGQRPSGGYSGLWQLYTLLQQQAQGEFLLIFNDDAQVVNGDWLHNLESHHNQICIICPQYINTTSDKRGKNMMGVTQHLENMGNIFPLVHSKIPAITGNFGLHSSIDVWFRLLGEYAGITVNEPGIQLMHFGGEDSQHWLDNMGYYDAGGSYKMQHIIQEDANMVKRYIAEMAAQERH